MDEGIRGKTVMNFIYDFLHQEVPESGSEMPVYYFRALFFSDLILTLYFVLSMLVLLITTGEWNWPPFVILIGYIACFASIRKMSARLNLFLYSLAVCVWLTWYVYMFGWSSGSPNILVPILSLAFFNIYLPPMAKLAYFFALIIFRIGLFTFSLNHTPAGSLSPSANLVFQIVNSVLPLLVLAIDYILFSSSIQESERTLTINNQELHKEAGTDPLTRLPNRRAMLNTIESFRREHPESSFCLAIADIDFFKKVNDTYGHQCGDYTLTKLSELFRDFSEERYAVSRWGGEEFCFFLPNMNLDQGGYIMQELCFKVRKTQFHFNDIDFFITITIGVDEYDFKSSTEVLLDLADQKLYMGKVNGRNQVVI